MKICRICNESKPFEMFSPDKQKRDGLKLYCKECRNKRDLKLKKLRLTNNHVELFRELKRIVKTKN
jgi:superfamily II helicase